MANVQANVQVETQRQTRMQEGLALMWAPVPGAIRYGFIVGFADLPVPPVDVIMKGATKDFAILGIPAKYSGAVDLGSPVGEERQYGLVAYRGDGTIVPVPGVSFAGARSALRDREYHALQPPALVRSQPLVPVAPPAAPLAAPAEVRAPSADPWAVLRELEAAQPAPTPAAQPAPVTPPSPVTPPVDPWDVLGAPAGAEDVEAFEEPAAVAALAASATANIEYAQPQDASVTPFEPSVVPAAPAPVADPWDVLNILSAGDIAYDDAPAVEEVTLVELDAFAAPATFDASNALAEPLSVAESAFAARPAVAYDASLTPPSRVEPSEELTAPMGRAIEEPAPPAMVDEPLAAPVQDVTADVALDAAHAAHAAHAAPGTVYVEPEVAYAVAAAVEAAPAHEREDAPALDAPSVEREPVPVPEPVELSEAVTMPPSISVAAARVEEPVAATDVEERAASMTVEEPDAAPVADATPVAAAVAGIVALAEDVVPDAEPHLAPVIERTDAVGEPSAFRPAQTLGDGGPVPWLAPELEPAPEPPAAVEPEPAPVAESAIGGFSYWPDDSDTDAYRGLAALLEPGAVVQETLDVPELDAPASPSFEPVAAPLDPQTAASVAALLDEAELYLLPSWLDYAEAARLVGQATALAPSDPRVQNLQQQIAQAQGGAAGGDVDALLREARQTLDAGDHWRAVALYEHALARQEDNDEARQGLERARLYGRWGSQRAAAGSDPARLRALGDQFGAAPELAARAYADLFDLTSSVAALCGHLLALADGGDSAAVVDAARRGVQTLRADNRIVAGEAQERALALLSHTPDHAALREAVAELARTLESSALQ